MRAYRGVVKNGKVILQEGVYLPEGTQVTVTVGELELVRAHMRLALSRKTLRRVRARSRVLYPEPGSA